jgi:hypothetical protein
LPRPFRRFWLGLKGLQTQTPQKHEKAQKKVLFFWAKLLFSCQNGQFLGGHICKLLPL